MPPKSLASPLTAPKPSQEGPWAHSSSWVREKRELGMQQGAEGLFQPVPDLTGAFWGNERGLGGEELEKGGSDLIWVREGGGSLLQSLPWGG